MQVLETITNEYWEKGRDFRDKIIQGKNSGGTVSSNICPFNLGSKLRRSENSRSVLAIDALTGAIEFKPYFCTIQ